MPVLVIETSGDATQHGCEYLASTGWVGFEQKYGQGAGADKDCGASGFRVGS